MYSASSKDRSNPPPFFFMIMATKTKLVSPKRTYHNKITVLATPASIRKHQADYRTGAWMEYTVTELAEIIAYKSKLATHYVNVPKREKALQDAHNYLDMLEAKLSA